MTFVPQNNYSKHDLIDCANGDLFTKDGDGRLPSDEMLMFDEIKNIDDFGGAYEKGSIDARLQIHPDLWFFKCHFKTDPVMPGCLGLDAMWQLLGFYGLGCLELEELLELKMLNSLGKFYLQLKKLGIKLISKEL